MDFDHRRIENFTIDELGSDINEFFSRLKKVVIAYKREENAF